MTRPLADAISAIGVLFSGLMDVAKSKDFPGLVEDALIELGIQAWSQDGLVKLPQHGLELEFEVRPGPEAPNAVLVQVDFRARSARLGQTAVLDTVAGFGTTHEDALNDAFRKFVLSSFHVFLAALTSYSGPGIHSEWIEWPSDKTHWKICVAPLLVHGGDSKDSTFAGFIDLLLELFTRSVDGGTHWVSVFVSSLDGESAGVDVRLDNQPWAEGNTLAQNWDWKYPDGYYSLRHFFIAKPAN